MKKSYPLNTFFIYLFFLLLIFNNNIFTRSRYFSDGNEGKKRPKVLVFNFVNTHPAKKYNEYSRRITDDITSKFSSDEVEADNIKQMPLYKISALDNTEVLKRIAVACKAYKKGFALIGEYKVAKLLNKKNERIIITVALYDAKLNLILLKQKFAGFSGLGYYNLIDRITFFIEEKLQIYKNDMDKIVRAMQNTNEKPLQEKGVIETGIGTHMADPTYTQSKGSFMASIMPYYIKHYIEFNNPMDIKTLSVKLDLSYGITDYFKAGIDIAYIYFNKRHGGGGDFHLKSRLVNPVFYVKYKFKNQGRDTFNFSLKLSLQPNLSEKTYSTTSHIVRFASTIGTYALEFAFSGTYSILTGFFVLDLKYVNTNDTEDYYDDDRIEYIHYKTNDTIFLELYFGAIVQLSAFFSIDFRMIFRKQSPIESEIKYKMIGSPQDEKVETDLNLSFLFAIYIKPDNNTSISLQARYFLPYHLNNVNDSNEINTHYEINLNFTFFIRSL